MSKNTEIAAAEWLAVRERVVERLRETSPRSEKDTRVRMAEGLILAGYVDVEYIAAEMAEEEAERQRRIDSARAAREAVGAETEQGDEVAV
ncbi:hypothetical protein [Microbacterium sp. BDGP8]|uniref:hypothetical protein n=1 Tax=Microbacterium sp. BDGP8 TaxID=3035531 RepID=UPI00249E7CF5|nr:hypothetical protein [Microbacterium sp. BDGP8]WHE35169.1 hypothetical protein P6897_10720 [Microbacterium sp. BDGP8]